MGVKKRECGEKKNRGVRKRLFMRGETELGNTEKRGIRNGGRKHSLMVEKTNDDVMCLIGPWILGDECDHTST